ncbi:hypothetical protein ACTXT7_014139 [Hymenolepis weldensis]
MGAKHSQSTSVPPFDHENIVPTFKTITTTISSKLPPHCKQAVSIVIFASVGSRIGYEAAYSPHEEESRMYHPKGPNGVKV